MATNISELSTSTFDPITSGDRWDYRVIADGRVRGDPYVALTDLAERIVPSGDGDWDYDLHASLETVATLELAARAAASEARNACGRRPARS